MREGPGKLKEFYVSLCNRILNLNKSILFETLPPKKKQASEKKPGGENVCWKLMELGGLGQIMFSTHFQYVKKNC